MNRVGNLRVGVMSFVIVTLLFQFIFPAWAHAIQATPIRTLNVPWCSSNKDALNTHQSIPIQVSIKNSSTQKTKQANRHQHCMDCYTLNGGDSSLPSTQFTPALSTDTTDAGQFARTLHLGFSWIVALGRAPPSFADNNEVVML